MSEYWKSTPKYWCKHCKTFVRDSKLEKQNHEATPKHQGNLQRFLRDLHRNNEREEREKQRGKDEVARLKGITNGPSGTTDVPQGRKAAVSGSSDTRQATVTDRKRQLQQLADMGIAVPEDARREMAMAGDWQIQSVKPIFEETDEMPKLEPDETKETAALAVGVRKRNYDGDEEKEEAGERVVKRGWGSTTRSWQNEDKESLDALLSTTISIKSNRNDPPHDEFAEDPPNRGAPSDDLPTPGADLDAKESNIKREVDEIGDSTAEQNTLSSVPAGVAIKSEENVKEPGILFKKRKSKKARTKE